MTTQKAILWLTIQGKVDQMLKFKNLEINPHELTIRDRTQFLRLLDCFGLKYEILEENKQIWDEWLEEEISPKEIIISVRNLND